MAENPKAVSVASLTKDLLDRKKGALYTLKKAFLAPWRAYDAFINGEDKALISPFKILLAILPIMAALEFIFPNDTMTKVLAEELASLGTSGYEIGYEGAKGEQLPEEEIKARLSAQQQESEALVGFLGDYPIVSLLLNIVLFASGIKLVYFRRLTLIEAAYLVAYMVVPTTIVSSGFLYSWFAINGLENGVIVGLVISQLLYILLIGIYLFQVAKGYYGYGVAGSLIRTLGVYIAAQLIPVFIGVIGAATGLLS